MSTPLPKNRQDELVKLGSPWNQVISRQIIAEARMMQSRAVADAIVALARGTVRMVRRWVVEPVGDWYARGELREELYALDSRMLADLGITRWQIENLVAEAYPPRGIPTQIAKAVRALGRWVVDAGDTIARAGKAQRTYESLSHLGDASLSRLGLTRSDIPRAVLNVMEGRDMTAVNAAPKPETSPVVIEGGRRRTDGETASEHRPLAA